MEAMKRLTILLLFITLLVACSPSGEPAASESQAQPVDEVAEVVEVATAVLPTTNAPRTEDLPAPVIEEPEATSAPPETEPMELPENEETVEIDMPVEEVEPTAVPVEETGPTVISGRLDEGAFFLGDLNAPVTLIDYSDFL